MSALDGAFDELSEEAIATIPAATLDALSSGSHTILVRGQDAASPVGNWGAFALATIFVDHTGPATTGLVLSPNPSNGIVDVTLSATGDDSANGNSNITDAEYFIDVTGADDAGTHITPNVEAPVVSLNTTIPALTVAGLSQGAHAVFVHSKDVTEHWGAFTQLNLLVDMTAPATSNVTLYPNPNNGNTGISPTQPVIRVTATFDDLIVTLEAKPNRLGRNLFNVHSVSTEPTTTPNVARVSLNFRYIGDAREPLIAIAEEVETNLYQAAGNYLTQAGPWQIDVIIQRYGMAATVARFRWMAPPAGELQPVLISKAPWTALLTNLAVALVVLLGLAIGLAGLYSRRSRYRPPAQPKMPIAQTQPGHGD